MANCLKNSQNPVRKCSSFLVSGNSSIARPKYWFLVLRKMTFSLNRRIFTLNILSPDPLIFLPLSSKYVICIRPIHCEFSTQKAF